jgi:hypothetical protein
MFNDLIVAIEIMMVISAIGWVIGMVCLIKSTK